MLNWLRQLSPGYPHIRSDFLITNLLLRNTFMRNMIAHRRLGYMGDGSKIDFQVNIQNAPNVKIGKKVKIQNGSFLSAGTGPDRSISIGDYTLAAGNIIIITSNYDIRTGLEGYIRDYPMRKGPVEITIECQYEFGLMTNDEVSEYLDQAIGRGPQFLVAFTDNWHRGIIQNRITAQQPDHW